jgi:hypothetical protein
VSRSLSIPEVLTNFESLGNNCEFGIVQRAAGYDPPGLFRNVGFLKTEQIIRAIDTSLEGMFDEGLFAFSQPDGWPDHAVDCKQFGFRFHTGIPTDGDRTGDLAKCITLFRFLKDKFLSDLRDGEKTFVYRHNEESGDALAELLFAAIRKHGPGWLLYVRQDKRPEKRFAWAEARKEGLFHAGISRLSAENPPQIDFAAWEKITRLVLGFRDRQAQEHYSASSSPYHLSSVNNSANVVMHSLPAQPYREPREVLVMQCEGLEPNASYTAAASIYVPDDFDGDAIGLAMLGYPSTQVVRVDLAKRNCWQQISTTAQIPNSSTRAVPVLSASYSATEETRLYSKDWKFTVGKGGASNKI